MDPRSVRPDRTLASAAALAAQDAPRLRDAYSLKGSCSYFSAGEAYRAALAIELLGQIGSL